jgi:hypothetical protein
VIIQGPFGTGKSMCIAELAGDRVLITAHLNAPATIWCGS